MERKTSAFVGCDVSGLEMSFEVLFESGVCQKGNLNGFVVWRWCHVL